MVGTEEERVTHETERDGICGCVCVCVCVWGGVLTNLGHSWHSTNQDDLSNVRLFHLSILQSFLTGADGTFHQGFHQRFKLGPGQLQVHVFRATGIHSQVRQVDVRLQRQSWLAYTGQSILSLSFFLWQKCFRLSSPSCFISEYEAMKYIVKATLVRKELLSFFDPKMPFYGYTPCTVKKPQVWEYSMLWIRVHASWLQMACS